MSFNYSKLLGKVKEVFKTQAAFSEAMGIGLTAINQKLNGKSEWSTTEIVKACDLLGISLAEAYIYFFDEKVLKS